MGMDATVVRRVLKIRGAEGPVAQEEDDLLAREVRLSVNVNGSRVVSLYCTPLMIRELVVGLLMTEGIASGLCTERMAIEYDGGEVRVEAVAEGEVRAEGGSITSGCVGGITFARKETGAARADALRVSPMRIRELFRLFQRRSELYDTTGCIHSAAVADPEEILCFTEDIGRHNAVDKALGYMIMEGIGFSGKLMLASGRLSSEIVSKCSRWGIPVVVSRTAPTALAIEMAEEGGVTVVGFVRGDRMNVYTHKERISL